MITEPQTKTTASRPSLLRSTGVVSVLTLASRVLGLCRDVVLAQFFGAGVASDAFFVAFKIPNFLRRLFAEGAFSQAFVPVLAEYRERANPEDVRELIANTSGLLCVLLGFLTVLCVLGSPLLVWVFAPGFSQEPEKMALAAGLLRLTFPYIFFIALVALSASVLNAYGHFATPAAAPIVLNLVLISCAIVAPDFAEPIRTLGWGVLIAGILQWAMQLPSLRRRKVLVWPRLNWRHEGVRRIGALMVPALFGVSVSQINLLLDTVLASFLASGSVSWLYYADRLMELPLGVFGIAIATVILPRLSQEHAGQDPDAYARTLSWGLRLVLMVGVPASMALCVLAVPILATLFQYRAFSAADTLQSMLALRAYSIGIVAFMLIKVLAPGFFARQDTKTPVKIAVMGLALATSLAALLNASMLYRALRQAGIYRCEPGDGRFAWCVVLATILMSSVLVWVTPSDTFWFTTSLWLRVATLSGLMLLGLSAYLATLYALGVRPHVLTPTTAVKMHGECAHESSGDPL
ncbi:MAG: murein biosynthesis integral membrane protein MurJ [Gammaproteobacteria bacterium]